MPLKKRLDGVYVNRPKKAQAAFGWVLPVLQRIQVPYQVSGGLTPKVYGSTRPLIDIDIDIPDSAFEAIMAEVGKYVVFGPHYWTGEGFKVFLMTLNYHGQIVDIGGSNLTKIWHKSKHRWTPLKSNFLDVTWKRILDKRSKVIPEEDLVAYKDASSKKPDAKR